MGSVEGEPLMLMLVAAALLAGPQDDPSVLYREGLYEEIDQGNLEKALDLYGRLLKGNAEPGLKARAFYRRGACLEKTGKKAEAEQVYRDVQERFPEQAEIVKQARGRLAALGGNGGGPAYSPEGEIQQLVLDLGAHERLTREKAIHRLTLIGAAAIPDLKRALGHKDPALAAGAARALLVLEPGEGLYEALIRGRDREDLRSLGKLFEARPGDQERFFKDAETLPEGALNLAVYSAAPFTRDPRLLRVVEDRLVRERGAANDSTLPAIWWQIADAKKLPGILPRLLKDEGTTHLRLYWFLSAGGARLNEVIPETSALLREGLKDLESPNAEWVELLTLLISPTDLIRGLFPIWLRREDAKRRVEAAKAFHYVSGNEAVDYMFQVLASDEYPDDVKSALFQNSSAAEQLAQGKQKEQLIKYYLGVLRKEEIKTETLLVRISTGDAGGSRSYVYLYLPDDAPEWDWLFDQEMLLWSPGAAAPRKLDERLKPSEQLRARYVQATMRALAGSSDRARARAVWQHQQYATRAEQRALAKILLDFPQEDLVAQVAHHLVMGFYSLTPEEWKVEVRAIEPLLKCPRAATRRAVVGEFGKLPEAALGGLMKEAMSDSDVWVRGYAIEYWALRRVPEGSALLIEALRDESDQNKVRAVQALARAPSLDAVPPLLELLRSPNEELRKGAQAALKSIQQYFDEQEQWRKWYEDMKKRVPKEK
jgi:HEAT repeat protein